MTKLILPSILVASALIAVVFAFMPVDEAQAVHTTVTSTQMTRVSVLSGASLTGDGTATCTSDAAFTVFLVTSGPAADNTAEVITIVHDGVTVTYTGSQAESTQAGQGGYGGDGLSVSMYAEPDDAVTVAANSAIEYHVSLISTAGSTGGCTT